VKIKKRQCVVCGTTCNIICDHKNDFYNDARVLNQKTQVLDDFQPLCEHCNLQKRQIVKQEKNSKKLYGATNIPHLKPFGIDFIGKRKKFDLTDKDNKNGTFWYDPIIFTKYIAKKLLNKIERLQREKKELIIKLAIKNDL